MGSAEDKSYDYHNPVMLKEILELLIINKKGLYVDGTLGGGGHSSEIFKKLDVGGHLVSFDKDTDAIAHCRKKYKDLLAKEDPKWTIINDGFEQAYSYEEVKPGKVSGLLLDLGVSSHQLDDSTRGISYRINSDLDMRFGDKGKTAKDLVHAANEEELVQILRQFGEEPFSVPIARRIIEMRRASSLHTTYDLRKAVEDSVPPDIRFKSLSRVFQAIRIAVNSELKVLQNTLTQFMPLLEKNGRIAVLTYHSLEDKIVKDIFKAKTAKKRKAETPEEKLYSNYVKINPDFKNITKKPLPPSKEEISINVRARSAKLRVIEKIK